MPQQARGPRVHERWAHLRFSVVGQLLAAPPAKGELIRFDPQAAARIDHHGIRRRRRGQRQGLLGAHAPS